MSGVSEENASASFSASSSGQIAHGAAVVITERLAELPDLALPSSLYKEAARPPAAADVLEYLQALLQKDPAAFLARYGGVLQSQELNHFEALRSADFEVNHWLGYYAAQRMATADQAANPRRLPARVKNRRLAAMRRLAAQGEYFSDEAMRHRAPLLYHQQIGMFDEPREPVQAPRQDDGTAGAVERERSGRVACGKGPEQGPGGGFGGSCLAAALQRALVTRDAVPSSPPQSGVATAGDVPSAAERRADSAALPACAAAAATAAEPAMDRPAGLPRAEEAAGRGGAGAEPRGAHGLEDMEVQDGPGVSGRRWAAARGGGAQALAAGAADAAGGSGSGGGVSGRADLLFSEFLLRQDDEAQLVRRRLQEQLEEDAQMSEHESEDEVEDEEDGDGDDDYHTDWRLGAGGAAASGRSRGRGHPSALDRARMRRDFVSEMQSRFLLGQDGQYVDYGAIDVDASLDGDWLEEEARDAEEKYFDED